MTSGAYYQAGVGAPSTASFGVYTCSAGSSPGCVWLRLLRAAIVVMTLSSGFCFAVSDRARWVSCALLDVCLLTLGKPSFTKETLVTQFRVVWRWIIVHGLVVSLFGRFPCLDVVRVVKREP